MNHSNFPWSPLGTLLVEKRLRSSAQLEWALAGQHRSGRLLGEILVQSGYVSALSLSFALAEQHGVELRPASNSATETDPEPPPRTDARSTGSTEDPTWRPLGRLLVERGFASRTELDSSRGGGLRVRVRRRPRAGGRRDPARTRGRERDGLDLQQEPGRGGGRLARPPGRHLRLRPNAVGCFHSARA